VQETEEFINALEEAVKMARASIAVFGAPLALIAAQLRFLAAIDSVYVSIVATLALAVFAYGTVLAWNAAARTHLLLIKEKLLVSGRTTGKGIMYLSYVEAMFSTKDEEISEESLVRFSSTNRNLLMNLLISGYGLLLVLLMSVVWSTPN
jgi:hypothetical protein